MENKDRLTAFFEAENRRDWIAYRRFLSPDVVWVLRGDGLKTVRGIDDYLAAMRAAYEGSDATFVCEALYESGDGARIVAILADNLGERSCDVFEFSSGLICKEYEFLLG